VELSGKVFEHEKAFRLGGGEFGSRRLKILRSKLWGRAEVGSRRRGRISSMDVARPDGARVE